MISLAAVLVVAAPPKTGLVTPAWRAVKPLVHAPQAVQPARVRRVGVVDDAILKRERAHAGPFAPEGLPVRADDRLAEGVAGTLLTGPRPQILLAEVVRDGPRFPFLLGVRHPEVEVEVAAVGGRPRECPAHPLLVSLELGERGPRHRAERDVVVGEVDDGAVETVGDRRAGRAPGSVVGTE